MITFESLISGNPLGLINLVVYDLEKMLMVGVRTSMIENQRPGFEHPPHQSHTVGRIENIGQGPKNAVSGMALEEDPMELGVLQVDDCLSEKILIPLTPCLNHSVTEAPLSKTRLVAVPVFGKSTGMDSMKRTPELQLLSSKRVGVRK